jgi:thiosulfate/3-mercaptopyruvate sulfurtransferase
MRTLILAASIAALPFFATADCGGHGDPSTMLVSTTWLAEHIKDPNLVIFAIGLPKEFDAGHIPGSSLVELSAFAPAIDGLSTQLPPMADLAATFGKLGVNDNSRIVIYVTKNMNQLAARLYLTLDAMGFGRKTSILDGGLGVWQAEHRPVTTDAAVVKPGNVTPCAQNDVIASLDFVHANLHKPGVSLIDARATEFYDGSSASNNHTGHIPGAVSIPYTSVVDSQQKLKPVAELRAAFTAAGVKPGDKVVTYCHVGQQASLLYFVARYLGYNAELYDGSWQEWVRHEGMPIEAGH